MDGQDYFSKTADTGVDLSKYAPLIEDLELSEDQQSELLQTLWSIMSAFADFGFGIEPTQLICGWIEQSRCEVTPDGSDAVESGQKPTTRTFNAVADAPRSPAGKETP